MAARCRSRQAQPRARSLFSHASRGRHQACSRPPDRLVLPCKLLDELECHQARRRLGIYAPLLVSRRDRRLGSGETADRECGTGPGAGTLKEPGMVRFRGLAWVLFVVLISPAHGADLTTAQVREIAAAATPGKPADLSGKFLENLDLSNFDFKGANLSGTKLDGAHLSGADLSGAKLDLAWIMRANFTNADLSNASLLGLVVSSG